jgi:hypothetical protein
MKCRVLVFVQASLAVAKKICRRSDEPTVPNTYFNPTMHKPGAGHFHNRSKQRESRGDSMRAEKAEQFYTRCSHRTLERFRTI